MPTITWPPTVDSFRQLLTLTSRVRYLFWVITGRGRPIELTLRESLQLRLRSHSKLSNDYGVAYEIFVHDMYRPALRLDRASVKHVIDLGGNSGFTVIRFLSWFPNCRVIAVEPHPRHADALRQNVALNGWMDRVELVQAAAGPRQARAKLTDQGSGAKLGAETGIDVDVIDIFPLLLGRRIDVLKIDIEGSEHGILDDPRFAEIDARAVLMEWHRVKDVQDARERCCARLSSLGYTIDESFIVPGAGMIYGFRNQQETRAATEGLRP